MILYFKVGFNLVIRRVSPKMVADGGRAVCCIGQERLR